MNGSDTQRSLRLTRGNRVLKRLDRYVGIPLLIACGSWRSFLRRRPGDARFDVMGLLVTGAIGDTILVGGIVEDMKRTFPDSHIMLFTTAANYGAACLLLPSGSVIEIPIHNPLVAVSRLRKAGLNILFDFGQWSRLNALYSIFSGAEFIVGFRTAGQYRHFGYDRWIMHSSEVHELVNFQDLVRSVGIESTALPTIKIESKGLTPKIIAPLGSYVVFHAWSGGYMGYLKEWPIDYWTALGGKVADLGFKIVLSGGPRDKDRTARLHEAMESRLGGQIINMAGKLDLAATACLLRDAASVVSVNTGIMHLAAAVGAPVLAINGPVSRTRWGPLGPRSISADAEEPGCGFIDLGFEYRGHRHDCMQLITPNTVFGLLQPLLEHSRGGSKDSSKALFKKRGRR